MSAFRSGTFVSRFPLPIFSDAVIKLFIDMKKREENLMAIVIDKNNKVVGTVYPSKIIHTVFGGRKNNS